MNQTGVVNTKPEHVGIGESLLVWGETGVYRKGDTTCDSK